MILSAPAVVFSQHDGYGDEHAHEAIEAHSNEHVEETRDEAHHEGSDCYWNGFYMFSVEHGIAKF